VQVTSDRDGEEDPSVCTSREEVGLTPHLEVQQVLGILAAVAVASLSSFGEPGSPLKKVCTKGRLPPFARYAFYVTYQFLYLSSDFNAP
jgi:hypothetical protein